MLILIDIKGRKQKKIKTVPAVRNYIYQPIRVTNSVYVYSLIQECLLNARIFYLQEVIKERMGVHHYTKLTLFQQFQSDQIYGWNGLQYNQKGVILNGQ